MQTFCAHTTCFPSLQCEQRVHKKYLKLLGLKLVLAPRIQWIFPLFSFCPRRSCTIQHSNLRTASHEISSKALNCHYIIMELKVWDIVLHCFWSPFCIVGTLYVDQNLAPTEAGSDGTLCNAEPTGSRGSSAEVSYPCSTDGINIDTIPVKVIRGRYVIIRADAQICFFELYLTTYNVT